MISTGDYGTQTYTQQGQTTIVKPITTSKQSQPTNISIPGIIDPSQHMDALQSEIQVLGMDKNFLGTKIGNGK